MNRRRQSEAASRFEERRKRENEAPRLHDEIPKLQSLRMALDEYRTRDESPLFSHVRHIVVGRAPALFVVPCSEQDCDGDHNLTRDVMRLLESSTTQFEGEDECYGLRNASTCHRTLHYRVDATYTS